jgi:hypothetical protein
MAGERRFTRIPPESSGDRVSVTHSYEIPYDGLVGHSWKVGEEYLISGNPGGIPGPDVVFTLNSVNIIDASTGVLHVTFDDASMYDGDQILEDQDISYPAVNGSIIATVNVGFYSIYINNQQIVGRNNPEYAVNVDRFGGLYTRFTEGAPELTSYNKLRVSQPILLGQYDFSEQSLRSQFATSQEGSGEANWLPDFGHVKIASYLSGDRATYTSSLWHPCPAGAGVIFLFSARCSSLGSPTDGTLRFWGAFDATDGAFFANAQGTISVRHRWTVNGTTNNMVIAQSDWNQDTLDGTGGVSNPSGMDLDVTKQNLYWVDFQHYGGGRIRWGVYYQGERIVCHVMDMGNGSMAGNTLYNSYSNPSRPLCWACAKRSDPILPGGAPDPLQEESIYAMGGAVYLEAEADLLAEGNYRQYADNYTLAANNTNTTYLATLRPQPTNPEIDASIALGNAVYTGENHTLYAPQKLEVTAVGDRVQITDADVATNVLTVTTSVPHYLAVDDGVDIYGTATVNGRYTVLSVTSPTVFTANAPGVADTTNETGELVGPKDGDTDSRMLEVRLFQKCVVRGVSFNNINFTTVETDEYADHVAHGPEFARFVVDGRYTYDFSDHFNKIQNGTVRNSSDQSFARSFQTLTSLAGNLDAYSTGVDRVIAKVGPHPIFGTTIHLFDDKGQVIVRRSERDGVNEKDFDNTNYPNIKITEGDWHYISIIDRDEAWLYNSTSDIDDDRSVRLYDMGAVNPATIAVGDVVTQGLAGPRAEVTQIYQKASKYFIAVKGRGLSWSDAFTGNLYEGGVDTTYTVAGITKSSDRIGQTSGDWSGWTESNERTTFDLDYETSLLAIDSSGWINASHDIVTELGATAIGLYGPDTFQPAWTFMARNIEPHKTDTSIRLNMSWKERVQ